MKYILFLLLTSNFYADVVSTTETIDFTISETSKQARLTKQGFIIGVADTNPSANLHISGNAIISEGLGIGGEPISGVNLMIYGTLHCSIQEVSTSGQVIDSSIALADTSSQSISVLLSNSASEGTVISIKKTSTNNTLTIDGDGANIEGNPSITTASGNLDCYNLIRGSSEWLITSIYSGD